MQIFLAGSAVGYNARREAPYNIGPNDPYSVAVNPNFQNQEPSQRLFWSNQGSNQVGGTGWWASLTNKFPILGNMFGRMEQLPSQYGVPNDLSTQYGEPSTQYGAPGYQTQYQNQVPQFYQQPPQQPQFYQSPQQPQFYQTPQQSGQRFVPSGRDVGFTDDAVIVTPPFVPVSQPQPAPAPFPQPAPAPFPQPAPAPVDQGYQYSKPQYRLELPHK
ncbi:Uncharacterized protein OBRU01_02750 [Operophtera brumata]|uniref:Uncharacterized protein n=1 Tax=Operophtera brumata TaxID=104452 RepID=A0A0L7LG07_OPEBR|nr:Uncharacterized protein OBRU01_02750 [Operophtera brumata]